MNKSEIPRYRRHRFVRLDLLCMEMLERLWRIRQSHSKSASPKPLSYDPSKRTVRSLLEAMIDKEDRAAITLQSSNQMRFAQLCARKQALKLELLGMRRSRGQSAYAICKKVYHLKGSRQRVYEQVCELVEKVKSGDVVFISPL